ARRKNAAKRGCGKKAIEFFEQDSPVYEADERFLRLDEAMEKLERVEPDLARLVKLRFYTGMTNAEVASLLNISTRTAHRNFSYARVWLKRELEEDD
ncbi:MAG: ECF-type sigma factor, partial [Verrucomicrobiota bacterium]